MKIAEVIINSQIKSVGKIYHYIAEDDAKVGIRVLVPFGGSNKTCEGYIVGFATESDYQGQLKSIKLVLDSEPVLSSERIELARYISKTCLVTMAQAIRLLLPPALAVKTEKRVKLLGASDNLTEIQKNVVDILSSSGKDIEIGKLMRAAGLKSRSAINTLEKKGVVRVFDKMVGGSGDKIRQFATIIIEENMYDYALEELANTSPKAAAALEVLSEQSSMPVADLMASADCGRSSVALLEKRGYIIIEEKKVFRRPSEIGEATDKPKKPTGQQKEAIDYITRALSKSKYETILLHGVTGSGKTEVFLHAAAQCIKQVKNAIILVPEISLTPQMADRVTGRFGSSVALLHSGLSMGERYDEWCRIKNGEVKLVVGARSAIFAPFDNVGLIIVDEEHDDSYKSEAAPCYSAVNVALFRGMQYDSTVILASATPSVSTYYQAETGKYKILELSDRINNQQMPEVEIVNMCGELAAGNKSMLSRRLCEEIQKNLDNRQQTILFLNRRGFSTFVTCRSCGYVAKCPHCEISLTYHSKNKLVCHYCGYESDNLYTCPECDSPHIRYFGTGTQKVEDELKKLFPGISVIRMDADTTSGRHAHQNILSRFEKEKIDVLIGTQMVTKGIDFPLVTLVGVISADIMLNMDDYRAAERSFNILTQVCGRAGRGEIKGRAIIQSYTPAAPALQLAKTQDYKRFYKGEIKLRQLLNNPPFTRIINIVVSGENDAETEKYTHFINRVLKKYLELYNVKCIDYFEPAKAPLSKIKNKYRYRILLKVSSEKILDVLKSMLGEHEKGRSKLSVIAVINPNSIL
ncbi:MAG: primosomal protein N' [Monoglobales bacterium]